MGNINKRPIVDPHTGERYFSESYIRDYIKENFVKKPGTDGFQPTEASKEQQDNRDGKLHLSVKRKKLKFNLND